MTDYNLSDHNLHGMTYTHFKFPDCRYIIKNFPMPENILRDHSHIQILIAIDQHIHDLYIYNTYFYI